MLSNFVHARLVVLVAALPFAFVAQTRAHGQEPALEVFYTKLEPKEQFKYKWKGQEAVCTAGVFRWEVPQTEFGTSGLDRNFTGYCAEVLVPIVADKMYRFQMSNIYAVENYNLAGLENEKANAAADRRTKLVQELFGRYFRDPIIKPVNADEAVAFQIAIWEIIQESEPAEGDLKLDLFGGDFQANYPRADAPASVLTAQKYLDSLTGSDDALFYENADLRGRELIRLRGIENAAGVVAQSQFALRFNGGGGVAGGNLARALTAAGGGLGGGAFGAGGAGGGLGGAPVGGLGGGFGGGGGGLIAGGGGNNGNGRTFPTTTPNVPAPTSPTTPPTTTLTTPPVGGPESPNPPPNPPTNPPPPPPVTPGPTINPLTPNAVPAPAGLLLGAIALGTFGTWRLGVRLLTAK